MAKLTKPQRELLFEIDRKGRQRVVSNYKPAAALVRLGLATIEVVEGAYAWRVTIEPAGHAALAEKKQDG